MKKVTKTTATKRSVAKDLAPKKHPKGGAFLSKTALTGMEVEPVDFRPRSSLVGMEVEPVDFSPRPRI
jgi:hypothetical protein